MSPSAGSGADELRRQASRGSGFKYLPAKFQKARTANYADRWRGGFSLIARSLASGGMPPLREAQRHERVKSTERCRSESSRQVLVALVGALRTPVRQEGESAVPFGHATIRGKKADRLVSTGGPARSTKAWA